MLIFFLGKQCRSRDKWKNVVSPGQATYDNVAHAHCMLENND
jgi:hypothetical protein